MEELKPCPFCGGNIITIIEHEPNIYENRFHALCVRCLCRGASKAIYEEAIEAWNRRYNNECCGKGVKKMRLIDANALIKEANAEGAYGYVDAEQIANAPTIDVEKISDGYHTFADLYEQRLILSAALAKNNPHAWKSKRHEDGSVPFGGGWFIMGFDTDEGCYTYHYELKDWDLFQCKELDKGRPWDGHTSRDVRRLLSIPAAVSVPQWISVKDRLPENNERVLAFCIDHSVHDVVWSWPDNCWYDRGADVLTYKEGLVTHWMPPPELPKGLQGRLCVVQQKKQTAF